MAVLLLPVYLLFKILFHSDREISAQAEFTGVETCIECHLPEYNDWLKSHHYKAMNYANDSSVLANFNNVSLVSQGLTHRFFLEKMASLW